MDDEFKKKLAEILALFASLTIKSDMTEDWWKSIEKDHGLDRIDLEKWIELGRSVGRRLR